MSLDVDEYLATGDVPQPRHGLLTGRYACYDNYGAARRRWLPSLRSSRTSGRTSAGSSVAQWIPRQIDDAEQDEIRADCGPLRDARPRRVGRDACAGRHVRRARAVGARDRRGRAVRGADAFVDAEHATAGRFRQVGPVLAGQARPTSAYELRDATATDVDELLAGAGFAVEEIEQLRADGVVA